MDKIYIHNLVKNINDKKNKKEIVTVLSEYIEKKQLNNYITLDDYIAIKESLPKDQEELIAMPHILLNLVYKQLPVGVHMFSNLTCIKDIITDINFVNKPPIGLYVGSNSCYHNAAMQILLKIPEFIKFNVDNYEFLFEYFNRIYISKDSKKGLISKYKYGYIELLNFILLCIFYIGFNTNIDNIRHQGACKIIYMKDNKKYSPEFGHQHSSEEFLVDIISEYSNISNISELFNNIIYSEITNIYYTIDYTIFNEPLFKSMYVKSNTLNIALVNVIDDSNIFIDVNNIKDTININIEGIINIKLTHTSHKFTSEIENRPYIQLSDSPHKINILDLLKSYSRDKAYIKSSIEKNKSDIYKTCTLKLYNIKTTVCRNYLLFKQGQQKINITIEKEIIYLNNTYILVGYIEGGNLEGGHYIAHILVDDHIYTCNDAHNLLKKLFSRVEAQPSILLYRNKTLNANITLNPDKEIHNLEKFLTPFSERINEYINS